ncbi:hypothetical protein FXN61_16595 [Lentzea sp. PSKA42]|uniref:Uncharacterized protein n=1 Tax=Lentzea indica TaxID=2604800 RepID=A0ABX1FHU4_9PSEU|nr:hypothetical protein [Lentzea indica]
MNTTRPDASLASSPPPAGCVVTPVVANPNLTLAMFGFFAASRFFTTRICEKPCTDAVSFKSTPGSTSA